MNHIVLVGCCGPKLGRIAAARDLYRSPLFRLSSTWAQAHGDAWMILSAKYGLIKPDDKLAPYDLALGDRSPQERGRWAVQVQDQVDALELAQGPSRFTLLAGEAYATWVRPVDSVVQPMAGMMIGRRLQWLNEQLALAEGIPA